MKVDGYRCTIDELVRLLQKHGDMPYGVTPINLIYDSSKREVRFEVTGEDAREFTDEVIYHRLFRWIGVNNGQ
jgi:hypothetical protein